MFSFRIVVRSQDRSSHNVGITLSCREGWWTQAGASAEISDFLTVYMAHLLLLDRPDTTTHPILVLYHTHASRTSHETAILHALLHAVFPFRKCPDRRREHTAQQSFLLYYLNTWRKCGLWAAQTGVSAFQVSYPLHTSSVYIFLFIAFTTLSF